jgi:hypothetical protein
MYTVDLLLSLAPIIPRTGPLKSGHTIVFSFSLSTLFFLWNTVYCLDVVHEYQILVAFVVVVWKQGTRDETFIKKKHPCFFITNSKNIFSCEKIHEPSPSHNGNQIMDLYPACRETGGCFTILNLFLRKHMGFVVQSARHPFLRARTRSMYLDGSLSRRTNYILFSSLNIYRLLI